MRAVFILALSAAVGACAGGDDEGPFRPGGGGGGGSGQGGDARQIDAAFGDGGGEVNGLICSVSDLRFPGACPSVASQAGVTVSVIGSAATTTSGSDGRFTLPVLSTTVTLVAGAGSTTFERSYVPVTVNGVLVPTPVVTQTAFAAAINSLSPGPPDGGGTVVAYVVDANSPAVGVAFSTIEGSSVAPFYDNGSNTSWVQGGGTGAAGVALFVNVPAGSATLDGAAADTRVARATVPVAEDTVTFVELSLVTAP